MNGKLLITEKRNILQILSELRATQAWTSAIIYGSSTEKTGFQMANDVQDIYLSHNTLNKGHILTDGVELFSLDGISSITNHL